MLLLALYARTQLSARINRPFFGMAVCMAAWCFFYYVELTATLELRIWAARLKYGFTMFLVYFFLRITHAMTGRPSWFKGPSWLLVSVPAAFGSVLAVTSMWHRGFRYDFRLEETSVGVLLFFTRGVFDMPLITWFNLLSLMNVGLLFYASVFDRGLARKKAVLMLTAVGVPTLFNAVQFVGFEFIPGINIAPWLFLITGPILFFAAYDLQSLDLVALARDALLQKSQRAYALIDAKGILRDCNEPFLRLLSRESLPRAAPALLGLPGEILARLENPVAGQETGVLIQLPHWTGPRYFDITTRPLREDDPERRAFMVIWEDVTTRIRDHEQRQLVRQQELMLRDLHDGVGGIMAKIAVLADTRNHSEQAPERFRHIAALAREGNAEIRTLMGSLERDELTWPDLVDEIRRYGRVLFPEATARFDLEVQGDPPPGSVPLLSAMSLYRACREALHNAARHAGATEINVLVNFTPAAVTLCVADNGTGFPQHLEPGRGLGHIRRRITELGGAVDILGWPGVSITMRMPLPLPDLLRSQGGVS